MEAISENIENFVRDHNTTKDTVAKEIHISRSSLYDKLSGKRPWLLAEVIDLAAYMGCTVNDLLISPK